jgi:hypothetical protein
MLTIIMWIYHGAHASQWLYDRGGRLAGKGPPNLKIAKYRPKAHVVSIKVLINDIISVIIVQNGYNTVYLSFLDEC